ncbi:MAG: hypothetical protein WD271_04255 [Acidimicrobiia bacterium]
MADNGDARDERLSGLLEVEPLDELTRRRLVTTAVRASAPPARSSSRRLVVAAAIGGVVIAAGVGYLVSRDSDSATPTASRENADTASGSEKGTSTATPSSAPASLTPQSEQGALDDAAPAPRSSTEPTPRDAGDFGDLRVVANVDRLRTALARSDRAAASPREPPSDRVTSLLAQLRTRSCASELPAGTVVAIAAGRFGTRDAIVVQTELPDGTRSIDAIVAHPCEVRPLD